MGKAKPGFLLSATLMREQVPDFDAYPFSIPVVRALRTLRFHPKVTYLIGENASGKSTLIEALAIALGFNPEGGTKRFSFATRPSESKLHEYLRVARGPGRPKAGFFLRAESFFNVASRVDEYPEIWHLYGGRSLHEQSHGESFLALATNRFQPDGLYLLDEPEAALSLRGCLALLRRMHDLLEAGSQFVVATHSPIVLAYPGAWIYELSEEGMRRVTYEETDNVRLTRSFLDGPERFLRHLLSEEG